MVCARPSPPAQSARPTHVRRLSTRRSACSPPRASTPPHSTRWRRRPATRRAPSTRTSRRRRTSSSRSTSAGSKPAWPSSTRSSKPRRSPGTPSRQWPERRRSAASATTAGSPSSSSSGPTCSGTRSCASASRSLHARVIEPLEVAMVRHAEEVGEALPEDPRKLATARYAMQLGLQLERLTQPDVVDPDLGARMVSHSIDGGSQDGLPNQATSGLRKGPASKQGAARA